MRCATIPGEEVKPAGRRRLFSRRQGGDRAGQGGRLDQYRLVPPPPEFVMSASFTNQVLAQMKFVDQTQLQIRPTRFYGLTKHLDEKVAALHLDKAGRET